MAPSGMCSAGRIKHHLRLNIGRADSTILFVGYQAQGTLGRQILEGSRFVRIHGREWKVKAQIRQLDGFSGHADRSALLRWIGHLQRPPQHVFLTHGEEEAARHFAGEIRAAVRLAGVAPRVSASRGTGGRSAIDRPGGTPERLGGRRGARRARHVPGGAGTRAILPRQTGELPRIR